MKKNGDCYQSAFKFLLAHHRATLIHAEVAGQGPLAGWTFGHAYCILDGIAYDYSNGGQLEAPVEVYEAIGRVREIDNLHEYAFLEGTKRALEEKHYGPWDLKTEH